MSTQSGDRHHFYSPWVAFCGCRVWVLGIGLQTGWRSWVAQCTAKGGHHMWVVGTRVGCQWCPPGHLYLSHFLSFPLMGLYPPRVSATQAYTDFPMWIGFRLWQGGDRFREACASHYAVTYRFRPTQRESNIKVVSFSSGSSMGPKLSQIDSTIYSQSSKWQLYVATLGVIAFGT